MKKWLLLLLVFLVTPVSVFAQNNLRTNEVVSLNKDETIDQDFFASGEKVIISGTVNGDVYVAGGNIIVDGTINGDLLAAGGNINIGGNVNGDIRVAGGNINVASNTSGSVTALGGSINLNEGANIAKSVVIAGGSAQIFAPVGRGVSAAVGALTLGNSVGSGTLVGAGDLTLTANARINGNLTYYSQQEAHIPNQASISGQVVRRDVPRQAQPSPDPEDVFAGIKSAFTVAGFLSTLLLGILLLLLAPNLTKQVSENIQKRPVVSFGIGVLVMVLTPILIIILLITLIGIPLALISLAAYFIIMYIGSIFIALLIGQKILQNSQWKNSLIWSFVLGLVVLTIISIVPVLGSIIQFIAMLTGVGAYLITAKNLYQTLRSKNII